MAKTQQQKKAQTTPSKKETGNSSWWKGTAVVAVAAVLPYITVKLTEKNPSVPKKTFELFHPEDSAWAVPKWMELTGSVDIVDFSQVQQIDERVPMIMKNSPASGWEAISKWTPSYLKEKVPIFKNVRLTKDKSPLFIYEDELRMMRKWDETGEYIPLSNYERKNMTTEEFFSAEDPMYYSHLFQTFLADNLDKEAKPREFMLVVDDEKSIGGPDDYSTNFWIGKTGVSAGLHYDLTHNMYAQVSGCKRFLILEPSEMLRAKIFPRDHPHDRQSQLEIDEVGATLSTKLKAKVADLGPGDVLYLPPGFGHRVAAFECKGNVYSVSLNTWSKSVAKDIAESTNEISNVPERFRDISKDGHTKTIQSLGLYLTHLIEHISPRNNAREFVQRVVDERLNAQDSLAEALSCLGFDGSKCPASIFNVAAFEESNPELAVTVRQEADAMVKMFKPGNGFELDQSIVDILLQDFVERVSTLVVSIPKLCPYLMCFAVSS